MDCCAYNIEIFGIRVGGGGARIVLVNIFTCIKCTFRGGKPLYPFQPSTEWAWIIPWRWWETLDLGGIKQQAAGESCGVRRLTMFTFYEILQSDQIKKDRMGGVCRVYVRSKKYLQCKGEATWGCGRKIPHNP